MQSAISAKYKCKCQWRQAPFRPLFLPNSNCSHLLCVSLFSRSLFLLLSHGTHTYTYTHSHLRSKQGSSMCCFAVCTIPKLFPLCIGLSVRAAKYRSHTGEYFPLLVGCLFVFVFVFFSSLLLLSSCPSPHRLSSTSTPPPPPPPPSRPTPPSFNRPRLLSLFPDRCDLFGDNHRQVTPHSLCTLHPPLRSSPPHSPATSPPSTRTNYLQDTSTHDKSKRLHSPSLSRQTYLQAKLAEHNHTSHHTHTHPHTHTYIHTHAHTSNAPRSLHSGNLFHLQQNCVCVSRQINLLLTYSNTRTHSLDTCAECMGRRRDVSFLYYFGSSSLFPSCFGCLEEERHSGVYHMTQCSEL